MHSFIGHAIRWMVFGGCFFATLELAARVEQWIRYDAPLLGVYTYDSALFTTDEFGIRGKANGAYEKWQLNGFGFRGPEIQLAKDDRRLRVVCIGASETFGLYENEGKEWPRQLEDLLRRSGTDAEVINAALAGMSLSQRILHLQNRLIPFDPDVVVFMLEYGSYAGFNPERRKNQRRAVGLAPVDPGIIEGVTTFRMSGRLKDVLVPKMPVFIQDVIRQWERAAKLAIVRKDLGTKFRSFTSLTSTETAAFEKDLAILADKADAAGIKLVMVSPAMWFTEHTIAATYLSWPFIDESWWREAKETLSHGAKQFAEGRGIAFVDLSGIVDGHEAMYMKDMLHFNDLGAEQVAHAIARALIDRKSRLMAGQTLQHVE